MAESIQLSLLSEIERREMVSLTWGFVEGSLPASEIVSLAKQRVAAHDLEIDPDDLIEELIDRGLLFELRGNRFRSRFAETVRLLAQLRQLFEGRNWRNAPGLVSDFRIDRRPRRYPKRDIPPNIAWSELAQGGVADTVRERLWKLFTTKDDGSLLPLARFQVEATECLLRPIDADTATIVTAGTGSGKTYCFYLPAFLAIGAEVKENAYNVAALAIYPRVELLKDQLTGAVGMAQRVSAMLIASGARALRIGVLYADTPEQARDVIPKPTDPSWKKPWRSVGTAYICPLLRCPSCDGRLGWQESDIMSNIERLSCIEPNCGQVVGNVALTRRSLTSREPDFLFTTTEMLNRRMTDSSMRGLFGLRKAHRLAFILLDEAHTYSGTSGAQAALTLSRWRYALGDSKPIRWVGLSATLPDAEGFFSTLTGVGRDEVTLVSPATMDLEEEGAEYQLVLRGDPAGRTSLLSTTIQTIMLMGRMADRKSTVPGITTEPSNGVVGERGFVFADNLDVINRLYHNLADAEAYFVRKNKLVPQSRKLPLASLRAQGDDDRDRDVFGQWWWASGKLGRDVNDRLLLGRTSSQDSGVEANRDVIVATASLEVGYDDPGVGFVIQHKAPKSPAGFLQRKGRAGRRRGMRPWMLTVLSDYGLDRNAYTAYERLFDPDLPFLSLPIENLYLLRIQATFSLIEWLYEQISKDGRVENLWRALSRPNRISGKDRDKIVDLLKRLGRSVNDNDPIRQSLSVHLCGALNIDTARLEAILWEPPRGLMLEVIPTLTRRVECNWKLAFPMENQETEFFGNHPLPEFVPANLFSELSLPEVQIEPAGAKSSSLPLVQALNQLVPGRVTRRFAPNDDRLSHWIPCEWTTPVVQIDFSKFATKSHGFSFGESAIEAIRPWEVSLEVVPEGVQPTSNARWDWLSSFEPGPTPLSLPCPQQGSWAKRIVRMDAFTYSRRSPVLVRRYATEGKANIRVKDGSVITDHNIQFQSVCDGKPLAIGLEQYVDGIYAEFALRSALELSTIENELPTDVVAACKTTFFRHRIEQDEILLALVSANPFVLDWLAQIFLAAISLVADEHNASVQEATRVLRGRDLEIALDSMFPSRDQLNNDDAPAESADEEADAGTPENPESEQRLVRELRILIQNSEVIARLKVVASDLYAPPPLDWGNWLRDVATETISHLTLEAAGVVLSRTSNIATLLVDPLPAKDSANAAFWLTEETLGGAGVIEEIAQLCETDPQRWTRTIEASLAPTDLELAMSTLRNLCDLVRDDASVAEMVSTCSRCINHLERDALRQQLFAILGAKGHIVGRTFSSSVNARLLRPGMRRSFFELLSELDQHRHELQARIGIQIDLRIFCRMAAAHPQFGPRLRAEFISIRGSDLPVADVAQLLGGVLWPQPSEIRGSLFTSYHPFRKSRIQEPGLVRALFSSSDPLRVSLEDADWINRVGKILADHGVVQLSMPRTKARELRCALVTITTTSFDVGWMQLYAAVDRIESDAHRLTAVLVIREWN